MNLNLIILANVKFAQYTLQKEEGSLMKVVNFRKLFIINGEHNYCSNYCRS